MNKIRRKLKSITPKVMIILTLGIVLIMSGAGIMNYQSEKNRAVQRLQKTADQTAKRISNSLIYPLWNISHDEIEKTINLEMGDENVAAIVLYDEFHQYLVGKIEDQQGHIQDFNPGKDGSRLLNRNLIFREKEIHKGSEYMGKVRLYFTDHFLIRELNELALKISLLTVLLSAFTFIIIFLTLHKFVLTPLITLQNATQRLKATFSGADSENFRVQIGSGDEIDMLGRDFNDMADELIASQAQLRHTADHLQALLDEIPDAVVDLNLNRRITDINKTFCQMFGGDLDDFIGAPLTDLAAGADSKETIAGHLEPALLGQHVEFEWQVARQTGETFFVLVRMRLMHSGEKRHLLAVITDITERKKAEEAHRESEARYRRLVDNLGREYFFYIHNTEGIFTYVSPSVQDMLGFTQEEFMTHYSTYLTDNPVNRKAIEKTNLSLQGLKQQPYPVEIRDKSGCPLWLEVSESPIFDSKRKVTAIEGIAHDITARKLAQEALRESEERFRSLFEKSADAILLVENGEFTDCNQSAIDMLRASSKEQIIHSKPVEISPVYQPDGQLSNDKAEELSAKVITEGRHRFEWTHRRFNGEEFPTEVLLTLIPSGNRKLIHVVWRDITDRKAAEEALRSSEARLRAIGDNLPGGMVYQLIISPDGSRRFTYVSASVERMHEVTVNEVIKDASVLYNQILPEDRPGLMLEEERSVKMMIPFNMEARSCLPSGIVRWMKIASQPRLLPSGGVIFDGVEMDITNLKQIEKALRESGKKYRRLHESMTDAFIRVDLTGRIIETNKSFREMTGYTEKELSHLTYEELTPATWHEMEEEITREQVIARGYSDIYEKEYICKDGLVLPIELRAFLIRDDEGQPIGRWAIVRDITKRKKTEKALRESEQRYRTLFENAPIGITVMNPDQTFEYINPRFTEMLGYNLSDLPNKDIWFKKAYPDPDYRSYVITLWQSDFSEKKLAERTLKVMTKEKKEKVIHFRTAILENGDHLMSYEDVTELQELNDSLRNEISERIIAEKALRESEERYRTLFEGAPVGIGVTTVNGKLIAANEGLLQMLKASSREEAYRMDVKSIYLDPKERTRLMKQIAQDGFVHDHETRLKAMDGSVRDILMTLNRFNYAGEEAILSVVQDITWKKQAEEETRHLKNYLANIIDSMPSILVGVDKNGLVTQWNIAAEKQTGMSVEKAKGQPLDKVLPLLSNNISLIREAIKTNRTQSYPRLQSPTGNENRFLDVTVYPLVSNGVGGAVVRIDDITDRIRIEEMMIQTEKMLSVGGLAAGMAHEINNPLGIILAASQNVLRRVSPDLSANMKAAEDCGISLSAVHDYLAKRQILTFLDDIKIGVTRANQIVTNMLSFSRRPDELGALENMADLMEQTLLLAATDYDLKKKHDFRKIQIDKEYDPLTPPVSCQGSKIQQVFLNILRNAAEAMEESRSETNPPRITIRIAFSGKWVRIEIADNGPGMEEAVRKRVFEPFFTTKAPGVGTGLGLSVSYFIITENHGGTISVESSPGTGTRFIIQLPAAEENRI